MAGPASTTGRQRRAAGCLGPMAAPRARPRGGARGSRPVRVGPCESAPASQPDAAGIGRAPSARRVAGGPVSPRRAPRSGNRGVRRAPATCTAHGPACGPRGREARENARPGRTWRREGAGRGTGMSDREGRTSGSQRTACGANKSFRSVLAPPKNRSPRRRLPFQLGDIVRSWGVVSSKNLVRCAARPTSSWSGARRTFALP